MTDAETNQVPLESDAGIIAEYYRQAAPLHVKLATLLHGLNRYALVVHIRQQAATGDEADFQESKTE